MNVLAYIGLGSNLSNPFKQIDTARQAIKRLSGVEEQNFSSLYRSPAMTLNTNASTQPDYINAVMSVQTSLSPTSLLIALQAIENDQGRIRTERWGARTLDLDILLYGNDIIQTPDLIIPHQGMVQRAFVLYPLFEIAPNLMIPIHGNLLECLAQCPLNGLERFDHAL